MTAYKLVYLGGRVEYLYAASLEAAQAYARSRFAQLEAYVSPPAAIQTEAVIAPPAEPPSA